MYTMMETCRMTGMSYQTLKYYCNEGLVPDVQRDANNRRIFGEKNVKWIRDLSCLKNCRMGIQEMREYLDLCLQGPSTIARRQLVLEKKKKELQAQMQELQEALDYIDWKQDFYNDVQAGRKPYVSNLIR